MYLKIVLFALFVALLEQTGAFKPTSHEDYDIIGIDDFRFRRDSSKYGEASMNATQAVLKVRGEMTNTTAWRFESTPGYKAIVTDVTYSALNITYNNTRANFGPFNKKGKFVAILGQEVFNLTVNTTEIKEQCHLEVEIEAHDLHPLMDLSKFGIVGMVFNGSTNLRKEITRKLGASLEEPLSYLLSNLAKDYFAKNVDLDDLCKKIQDGTSTNFPEPIFKRNHN